MDAARQIFNTIDNLRVGSPDLFYSNKFISKEPEPSHVAWHLHKVTLSGVSRMPQIKRLYLQDCHWLESLDWLREFPNLEILWVYGSDKLANIEGIEFSNKLKSLTLWPSFSANITLDTLAPVAALNDLEELIYSGKTRDGSLAYLSCLQHLKSVFFSNSYSWEELARFESCHPAADFPWKGGVSYDVNPTVLKCKKCELPLAMLSGRGLKLSCPQCDAVYIRKHIERYQNISVS